MVDELFIEILNICKEIDSRARDIYREFAELVESESLKDFWLGMSADEAQHITYWQELADMARSGDLPPVFDNPRQVLEQMNVSRAKVDVLRKTIDASLSPTRALSIAFELEFFMLNPAFEVLLHTLKTISNTEEPEKSYGEHINKFTVMLHEYRDEAPELDIFAGILLQLWNDNRLLILQGNTDKLTGAYNRRGFLKMSMPLLYLAQRNKNNIIIMMGDIDDFKAVNDNHGHQKGDEVLCRIVAIMQDNVRASDVVGRYGGEEFIILLTRIEGEAVQKIADKIRSEIETKTKSDIPVTISIGLAGGIPGHKAEDDLEAYIAEADKCMYQAKQEGKNRVVINV